MYDISIFVFVRSDVLVIPFFPQKYVCFLHGSVWPFIGQQNVSDAIEGTQRLSGTHLVPAVRPRCVHSLNDQRPVPIPRQICK